MRRIAAWILGLLLIAALALGAWVSSIDTDRLRDTLAFELSKASGYPVSMQGELSLRLLPHPGLSVEQVRVSSAGPGEATRLAQAKQISIGVSLLQSLRRRVVVLRAVRLSGVEVWLSRDARGVPNWTPQAPKAPAPKKEGPLRIDPTPDDFELRDLELHFHDQAADRSFTLSGVNAQATREREGDGVTFEIKGQFQQEKFRFSGNLAPPAPGSGSGPSPWHLDVQANLSDGAAKASVRGVAGSPGHLEKLDLDASFSSDEPAALVRRLLGPQAGQWAEVLGSIHLKGRLRGDEGGGLTLDKTALEMGRAEHLVLKISGSVHDVLGERGVELTLKAQSPDVARALGPMGWSLSGLGTGHLSAELRGDAAAPKAENVRLVVEPHAGLKAEARGGLHYNDGIGGKLELSVDAKDLEALAEFVVAQAPAATGDLKAVLEESRGRPLLHHLLTLKPLAISSRISGTGTSWSLDQLSAATGVTGKDRLVLTGRARSIWPEPDGLELHLEGHVEAPGQLPGLAERPVAQIETLQASATLVHGTGSPTELKAVDVRARAHGGVELDLRGSLLLAATDSGQSGNLAIDLRAPSLLAIGKTWGGSLPAWGPVAAKGRLVGTLERLRLEAFTTRLGETRITGRGSLARTADIPRMELNLNADEIDLRGFRTEQTSPDSEKAPEDPGPSPLSEALAADRLALLSSTAGKLELRADRVLLDQEWTARDLRAHLQWEDGKLEGPDLTLQWPGGNLSMSSHLDATKTTPAASLGLRGTGLELSTFARWLDQAGMASGQFETTLDLSTRGADTEAVVKNLSGGLLVDAGEGTLADRYADAIALSIDPHQTSGSVPMTCFIGALAIENGLARTDALLWDSPPSQVRGAGVINLPDRSVDLLLRPHLKDTIATAITAAVRVKGPLGSLRIRPEPLHTATDLARGLIGRALHMVGKVSPQLSDAVIQLGTSTDKVLSSTGVDIPVVLSLLAEPVDCKTVRADPKVKALKAFEPSP